MRLREKGAKSMKELPEQHPDEPGKDREEIEMTEKAYDYLDEALAELNEEQRQCVILFYLKKYSYNQISEMTGYSMLQVKSYIQNGKRNLKIILDRKIREKSSSGK